MGNQPWAARLVLPQCAVPPAANPAGLVVCRAWPMAPGGEHGLGGTTAPHRGASTSRASATAAATPAQPQPTLLRCTALPIPNTYNSMSRGLM